MPYRFLEELATADIAFIAEGNTLAETFIAAADATLNVMVETLDAIFPRETKEFALDNERLDLLLFDFLQELIYYKDAQKLMLRVGRVQIKEKEEKFFLRANAQGEKLDPERHHPRVDVKAVTLHRFRLEKTDRGWEAFVILDI
ncbi:MAG TPA: archease [Thermodesulfobacteriota bacterium]|nr:archease [Thermodesulfobacteriota bacterium]